jgi:hypothetical protein
MIQQLTMTRRQEPAEGPKMKVKFVIRKSPHGYKDQLTVHR